MDYVVEASGLCKTFGSVPALRSVDLKVERGSAFALVGPNGAGKTTMIRVFSGILKPNAGTAYVLGKDASLEGGYVRSKCGFQTDAGLYEKLSAKDNLEIWGQLYGLEGDILSDRIEELLELFDLKERSGDLIGSFSKGMKQKLSIARALIHEPEVLFLDEPTAGLDPEASWELLAYLKRYVHTNHRTVFLCSHRLEEVESLCDHVAFLDRGGLLAAGSMDDLSKRIWPKPAYLIELKDGLEKHAAALLTGGLVSEAVLGDGRLRVVLEKREDISVVISFLVSEKAIILSASDELHTLQDVYFSLMPKNELPAH
jgi:ABC-2 type transport system ATP-binding protein